MQEPKGATVKEDNESVSIVSMLYREIFAAEGSAVHDSPAVFPVLPLDVLLMLTL